MGTLVICYRLTSHSQAPPENKYLNDGGLHQNGTVRSLNLTPLQLSVGTPYIMAFNSPLQMEGYEVLP